MFWDEADERRTTRWTDLAIMARAYLGSEATSRACLSGAEATQSIERAGGMSMSLTTLRGGTSSLKCQGACLDL